MSDNITAARRGVRFDWVPHGMKRDAHGAWVHIVDVHVLLALLEDAERTCDWRTPEQRALLYAIVDELVRFGVGGDT